MKNLGLYIHIPFCKSKCGYCSFVSKICDDTTMRLYVKKLIEEIKSRQTDLIVDSVYIGGGTPSVLYVGAINEILAAVKDSYVIAENCEITIEVNPESLTEEKLQEYVFNKINRISIGVQSFDNELLKTIGRPHSVEMADKAIEIAKRCVNNISCDIMIGLPGQTLKNLVTTVNQLIKYELRHISLYALKLEQGTPMFEKGILIDEDLQSEMYQNCYDILSEKGYHRYEVSNFSLPGYESRHNNKYWNLSPYLGFGAAAHSYIDGYRIANTENISKYTLGSGNVEKELITLSESRTEFIMLGLRLAKGIDLNEFTALYKENLLQTRKNEITSLLAMKMIEITDNRLIIAENAFYIMDSIVLKLI